jgi:hypothetical protein
MIQAVKSVYINETIKFYFNIILLSALVIQESNHIPHKTDNMTEAPSIREFITTVNKLCEIEVVGINKYQGPSHATI